MTLHKCSTPIIRHNPGGLNEIGPCAKLASVKSKLRKGYVCAKHALEEASNGRRG